MKRMNGMDAQIIFPFANPFMQKPASTPGKVVDAAEVRKKQAWMKEAASMTNQRPCGNENPSGTLFLFCLGENGEGMNGMRSGRCAVLGNRPNMFVARSMVNAVITYLRRVRGCGRCEWMALTHWRRRRRADQRGCMIVRIGV